MRPRFQNHTVSGGQGAEVGGQAFECGKRGVLKWPAQSALLATCYLLPFALRVLPTDLAARQGLLEFFRALVGDFCVHQQQQFEMAKVGQMGQRCIVNSFTTQT